MERKGRGTTEHIRKCRIQRDRVGGSKLEDSRPQSNLGHVFLARSVRLEKDIFHGYANCSSREMSTAGDMLRSAVAYKRTR
jgi:hypothetical protein